MKKILFLILILTVLVSPSFAQETDEEDINSYFVEDSEALEPVSAVLDGFVQYNQGFPEEDAVELDFSGTRGLNFTMPKKVESKSLLTNVKTPDFKPIEDGLDAASRFSSQEYDISPIRTAYSKKFGKFSVGTRYDSFLSGARVNYSTGIFAKFDGKYFAVASTLTKRTNNAYTAYNDTISFEPEWKLTKNLSLVDIMRTDVYQIDKSNQVVLRYRPKLGKYADDILFELGAGQRFYEDSYVNSSVTFSTQFKL